MWLRAITDPTPTDLMHKRVMAITGKDPLPYGIGPNRAMLSQLIGHAVSQHILPRAVPLETLFAPGTLDLDG